ncbi:MAG: flagellar protein FliS [Alteraurantiacibacter sp. bin_em_oilr2.035]|nr:flagellar protein FliS [Alteraurantiacibacter sp. bin_em_oilr2.035]
MLKRTDPAAAYKRVDFESLISGCDAQGLVRVCFDDAVAALERALWADAHDRPDIRRKALERAQMGLLTLLSGLDTSQPVSKSLDVFYRSLLARVTNAQKHFNRTAVEMTRDDLKDIAASLLGQPRKAA